MQVRLVWTSSVSVWCSWKLHIHDGRCSMYTSSISSVQHQKSIWKTVIILASKCLLIFIFGVQFTHLWSKLLSVSMRTTNLSTEKIASLSGSSLLSDSTWHVVGTSTRITVHFGHYLHLMGIHKFTTVCPSINCPNAMWTIRSTPNIGIRWEWLNFTLWRGCGNLVIIFLLMRVKTTYIALVRHILLHRS